MGTVVEKVVAEQLAEEAERRGLLAMATMMAGIGGQQLTWRQL